MRKIALAVSEKPTFGGHRFAKMLWRAASQIATTAGCLILRSTEIA
jgi:hypothetical protein